MRAIVYTEFGPSEVLTLVERPVPEPGTGEVRVRIAVSGVNPTDWKSRSGRGRGSRLVAGEQTPNQDGAGVIDAVGPGVDPTRVGERVWVYMAAHQRSGGTAQEYLVIPEVRVVRLPDSVSFDVGASLGVPAMTAHRALTVGERGPSRLGPGTMEGKTVLVSGGAGAVGHAAIQLARWSGASVISTVSSAQKADLALAAGARTVVNYRTDPVAERIRAAAPSGVDIVVEVAPSHNADLNAEVLAAHGVIGAYAIDGPTLTLDLGRHFTLYARYQFVLVYNGGEEVLAAAAEDLLAATADGALGVGAENGLPLHRFPLEEAAAAHDAVENRAVGKVVIDVADL